MKPNIIYIHSHDTGRYVSPYGYKLHTPNIQQLAEEGVLFRQNFCHNPTCSASRSVLVTGECAHSNGMLGLAHRGFRLNDYKKHLIHTLKEEGYSSYLAGVQHVAVNTDEQPAWKTIGYDKHLGPHEAENTASEFIKNSPDEPFFLSVGFIETHREYPEETPNEDEQYVMPPAPIPDTPETRRDMARYGESVRILDEKMGKVFNAVKESGKADNTLIICTTDHGIAFPRMKCNLHDSGIGVMLIIKGPGGFQGGKVIDGMTGHIDIFPTICDLLGIDPPERLQGTSFMPLVRGEKKEIHEEIFTEVSYHAAYEPMRSVRTNRYKYIKRYDKRKNPVLSNCDDGLSKDVCMDAGWLDRVPEEEMFYDLIFDPNETNNLIDRPEYSDILSDLKSRLQKWMEETNDPLLVDGTVPAPEGAVVNHPDSISPREKTEPAGKK